MSNIQFLTHQSRAERIHDNLEQLLDQSLSSITVASGGLTPNALAIPPVVDLGSRADQVGRLVNLYLSFVGGTFGPIYTINNSAFFPVSTVNGTASDSVGVSVAISISPAGLVSIVNPVAPAGPTVGLVTYYTL